MRAGKRRGPVSTQITHGGGNSLSPMIEPNCSDFIHACSVLGVFVPFRSIYSSIISLIIKALCESQASWRCSTSAVFRLGPHS